MKQGLHSAAYEAFTADIIKEPNRAPHYMNRGLCLLNMGRVEDALNDFREYIRLRSQSSAGYNRAGVALWLMGRMEEAIDIWRKAIDTKYRDAAGGVEIPALLFFAATRRSEQTLQAEAMKLLQTKWSPHLAKTWPGPIAGFLIGKMDEETFLVRQTYLDPVLESRRLCRAHFWVGVSYLGRGDAQTWKYHLQQAVPSRQLLESEYYLAKHELMHSESSTANSDA